MMPTLGLNPSESITQVATLKMSFLALFHKQALHGNLDSCSFVSEAPERQNNLQQKYVIRKFHLWALPENPRANTNRLKTASSLT